MAAVYTTLLSVAMWRYGDVSQRQSTLKAGFLKPFAVITAISSNSCLLQSLP